MFPSQVGGVSARGVVCVTKYCHQCNDNYQILIHFSNEPWQFSPSVTEVSDILSLALAGTTFYSPSLIYAQ